MSIKNIGLGDEIFNILYSEEGLVVKTRMGGVSTEAADMFPTSQYVEKDGKYILKQGSAFVEMQPDQLLVGVVADTYVFDSKEELKPISVIEGGHVIRQRLTQEAVDFVLSSQGASGIILHNEAKN